MPDPDRADWVPFINTTNQVIPGYALMAVDDVDANGNLLVIQPNAYGQLCIVNDQAIVTPGSGGQGTFDPRVIIAYDPSGSGPPNPGDIWGSTPNSWYAVFNPGGEAGFQIIGGAGAGAVNAVRVPASQTIPDCITGPIPNAFTAGISTQAAPVAGTAYSLPNPLGFTESGTYLMTCSVYVEVAAGSIPSAGAFPITVWMQANNSEFPGLASQAIPGTQTTFQLTDFTPEPGFKTMTGLVTVCANKSPTVEIRWAINTDSSAYSASTMQVGTATGGEGGLGAVVMLSEFCDCNTSGGSVIFPSGSSPPPPSGGSSGGIPSGHLSGGSGGGSSGTSGSSGGGSGSAGACCEPPPTNLFATYSNKVGPCAGSFIPLFLPNSGVQQWTATDAPVTVQCVNGLWGLSDTRYGLGYTVTQVMAQCGPPFIVVLNITYTSGPCVGTSYTMTLGTN